MYYDEKEKKLGQFSVMCATRQRWGILVKPLITNTELQVVLEG